MNDFFAELNRGKYWSLSRFLEECFNAPLAANVEEAILKLDQLSAAPIIEKSAFIDQCRRRRAEVTAELEQYMLERLGDLDFTPDNWAARWLLSASDTTTVITTNYDNLAESLLSRRPGVLHDGPTASCHHCRMRAILCNECTATPGAGNGSNRFWAGSLLKLHGSVAWKMCDNKECDSASCLVPDVGCRPFKDELCDSCGNACSPVIVHPSLSKTFDRFRGLRDMWNGAYEALSHCKRAVFFGFSFPTSDMVISEVIRLAMGCSTGPLEIGVIDVKPRGPAERIRELLRKRSTDAQIVELEVPQDGSSPDWVELEFSEIPACSF